MANEKREGKGRERESHEKSVVESGSGTIRRVSALALDRIYANPFIIDMMSCDSR